MKTTKLYTAVLSEIKQFVDNGVDFSAHDVTKALRQKCNNGELNLSDVDEDTVNGIDTCIVDHADVRDIVRELNDNNLLFGCVRTYLNNKNGDAYAVYQVPTNVPITTSTSTSSSANTVKVSLAPIKMPIVKLTTKIDSITMDKIENYIDNCDSKGFLPTLKKIQSRLKIKGITVRDLADTLRDNGYNVENLAITKPLSLRRVG